MFSHQNPVRAFRFTFKLATCPAYLFFLDVVLPVIDDEEYKFLLVWPFTGVKFEHWRINYSLHVSDAVLNDVLSKLNFWTAYL